MVDVQDDEIRKGVPELLKESNSSSAESVVGVEEDYGLTHVGYLDVIFHWITTNKPSKSDVELLWSKLRHTELHYNTVMAIKHSIPEHDQELDVPRPHPVADKPNNSLKQNIYRIDKKSLRLSGKHEDFYLLDINKNVPHGCAGCVKWRDLLFLSV